MIGIEFNFLIFVISACPGWVSDYLILAGLKVAAE